MPSGWEREGRRVGFPRFRRKGRRDSSRLTGSSEVHPRSVSLPRSGWVRTKETTEKFRGRILSATVSREADRGYVSLAVEVERDDRQPVEGPAVGIDLGLKCFAARSDGERLESRKPLAKARRRFRHRQQRSWAHSGNARRKSKRWRSCEDLRMNMVWGDSSARLKRYSEALGVNDLNDACRMHANYLKNGLQAAHLPAAAAAQGVAATSRVWPGSLGSVNS